MIQIMKIKVRSLISQQIVENNEQLDQTQKDQAQQSDLSTYPAG